MAGNKVSFLITHYNRPKDLKLCVEAIKELQIQNSEIIVSDDCSSSKVLEEIKLFPIDLLIEAPLNKGLAANLNKGLKACTGDYIIYCQEDFQLHRELAQKFPECISLLNDEKVDLIRFTSYFKFNKLIPLSLSFSIIPKFSLQNIHHNFYRYSDHPFIVKRDFHKKYGYYLEGTSGRYGETEYSMRMSNSDAKIAITNNYLASQIDGSTSILVNEMPSKKESIPVGKSVRKIARSFRLYFEWIFYNKESRGLITYKNGRKGQTAK